jgi:hypothetical protein
LFDACLDKWLETTTLTPKRSHRGETVTDHEELLILALLPIAIPPATYHGHGQQEVASTAQVEKYQGGCSPQQVFFGIDPLQKGFQLPEWAKPAITHRSSLTAANVYYANLIRLISADPKHRLCRNDQERWPPTTPPRTHREAARVDSCCGPRQPGPDGYQLGYSTGTSATARSRFEDCFALRLA